MINYYQILLLFISSCGAISENGILLSTAMDHFKMRNPNIISAQVDFLRTFVKYRKEQNEYFLTIKPSINGDIIKTKW